MRDQIKIEKLGAAAFQTYGNVLSMDDSRKTMDEDDYSWYPNMYHFTGKERLNILKCRERELTLSKIERHLYTKEIVIPFGTHDFVLVVAPAGDEVIEEEIRAFKLSPGEGVILNEGIRHFLPYPIGGDSSCLIIFEYLTEKNDLVFEDLSRTYNLT